MERSELEAADQIRQVLARVSPRLRGRVLRHAIDELEQRPSPAKGLPDVCAWCAASFKRRSYNQRFCSYACTRQDGAQRRLAATALQFALMHEDKGG